MIMFMDEIISKWGFGSGISLFIVAGVSKSLMVRAFSWSTGIEGTGEAQYAAGKVLQFFQALYNGDPQTAMTAEARATCFWPPASSLNFCFML